MLDKILRTSDDKMLTLLRVALGVLVFPHGAQKALGWFGGPGFSGTYGFFTHNLHIPAVLVLLSIAAEFLGSLGLIVGFLGRIAAFGILANFIVASSMVYNLGGFYFMNWAGTQKGEGIEYFILVLVVAIVIMVRGSGALSVDRALARDRSSSLPRV
jgi:putative oxidoreductase